jgi:hypothetical protein
MQDEYPNGKEGNIVVLTKRFPCSSVKSMRKAARLVWPQLGHADQRRKASTELGLKADQSIGVTRTL